jgi:hypothetical protein
MAEHLTLGETIPAQTLKKDYVKVEDKPFGQAGLGYTMVVPNSWIQLKLSAKDGRLLVEQPKLLATYLGPKDDNGNPMLQVWCQGLIREIGAADWLKDFLTKTGSTILSLEAHSPNLADALVGRVEGPARLKIRFAAHLSGNRLFLIQGIAPEDLFEKYADNFGLAVASFKPTLVGNNPHVELWQTHHLDKSVTFNAPFSWLERQPKCPPGLDLVDLYNLNAEGEPISNLKVMSVRRKLTKGKKGLDLPALLIAEFTKAGVRVTEIDENENFTAPKPLANGTSMICKAIIPKAKVKRLQNLLIVSVDAPTHHILTGLLTCAPNEGFYEYGVNRRAFDIVLETFKLPEAK